MGSNTPFNPIVPDGSKKINATKMNFQNNFNELLKTLQGIIENDFVISGFDIASSSGLDVTLNTGSAIISGYRVEEDGQTIITITDDTINYIYYQITVDGNDVVTAQEFVVNTTGVQPSNSIPIAEVTTASGSVDSQSDSRETGFWAANSSLLENHPANYFNQAIEYVLIKDEKTKGTNGGEFISGSWQTRTLNTIVSDEDSNASLSSNQITLSAGTYIVNGRAPAYAVLGHQARLHNITDGFTEIEGSSVYSYDTSSHATNNSFLYGVITLSESKVLEVQHICGQTKTTNGFGVAANVGSKEVYTEIEFTKIA